MLGCRFVGNLPSDGCEIWFCPLMIAPLASSAPKVMLPSVRMTGKTRLPSGILATLLKRKIADSKDLKNSLAPAKKKFPTAMAQCVAKGLNSWRSPSLEEIMYRSVTVFHSCLTSKADLFCGQEAESPWVELPSTVWLIESLEYMLKAAGQCHEWEQSGYHSALGEEEEMIGSGEKEGMERIGKKIPGQELWHAWERWMYPQTHSRN